MGYFRISALELSFDKQRRQFKEDFHQIVEEFKITTRKEFSLRIVELLHCFENESIDLNGRKYKLPMFH